MNVSSTTQHVPSTNSSLIMSRGLSVALGAFLMTIALTACTSPIKPVPTQQSQEAPPPPTEIADAPKPVEPARSESLPAPPLPAPFPPIGMDQPIAPHGEDEIPVVEARPVLVVASRESYVVPNATSGTKTDTPIMETPLNVQVIANQVMKDQQVIALGQALKNVSGVTVNSTGDPSLIGTGGLNQFLFLRGFASETFFRNGFRLQQGSASRGMANVESVEVLKGPAAILYGQVEPGGMVNVITKQPLAIPYYSLNQQFGSYNLYRTTIDATGPLATNETLLYRMNVSYQDSGSFREFVNTKDVFLAPVLKWNISPRTQATFELEYNHRRLGLDAEFVPLLDGKLFNMPRSRNYGESSPATMETIFGGFNWAHQFTSDWSIKHRFSFNQLRNNQPQFVVPFQADTVSVSRYFKSGDDRYTTLSTNLDLVGLFDTLGLKHTLLLGGDYYRLGQSSLLSFSFNDPTTLDFNLSTIDLLNPVHPGTAFTQPLQLLSRSSINVDQYGLYLQDQVRLPYDVHVLGGLRYQNIHQTSQTQFPGIYGIPNDSSALAQDAVTPRVGAVWHPQGWFSLYANYTESFGANFGKTWPDSKTVAPTSAHQYEGGIKTEFFGGRLRATLAYYDLTKTNVATSDLSHPGFVLAFGAVRSRGPELDIVGAILPGWNVIATYTNTEVRVTKTNSANEPLNGVTVGSRMPNVPRNTGSFWSTYEFKNGELKGLKLGGGVTLRDGQTACCDTPAGSIPGYVTADLLTAYSRKVGDAKVTVQLNVNNLLDKQYFAGIFTVRDANAAYVSFGQPRTFIGSINIEY
jgi:iron complex outermembrane receptor protein